MERVVAEKSKTDESCRTQMAGRPLRARIASGWKRTTGFQDRFDLKREDT